MSEKLTAQKRQQIVDRLAKELNKRLGEGNQEVDLEINWEVTKRIQKEEKYVRFNNWAKKYGVVAPSVEWPVAYGKNGDLVGVRAKKDIGLMESYIYVPCKLTINEEQFKRSWIGEIYDNHIQ